MSACKFLSLLFAGVCAVSLCSCGGGSGGSGSGYADGEDSAANNGEITGDGSEGAVESNPKALVPDNVVSASFMISCPNGVLLNLHLSHIFRDGVVWSADVDGEVVLPEDMAPPGDYGSGSVTFQLLPCRAQNIGHEGVKIQIEPNGMTPMGQEASLEIVDMELILTDEKQGRIGTVQSLGAEAYLTTAPVDMNPQPIKIPLGDMHGATVTLKYLQTK